MSSREHQYHSHDDRSPASHLDHPYPPDHPDACGSHVHSHDHHAHDHGHRHSHDHGHGHHSHRVAGTETARRLTLVLLLTGLFMIVEAVAGLWTNSVALQADAGHMLTDVAAIGLALFAFWFSRRSAPPTLTFGYLRFEMLAALVNGLALFGITALIFQEAWERMANPPAVKANEMLVVAFLGLLVNVISYTILARGDGHSLNERGAMLHVLGDMLGSVGAIIAALVMRSTGWYLADPIVSAIIGLLILRSTWALLREAVNILMEGTPLHLSFEELHREMLAVPGVQEVTDLHVWSLASGFDALSAHVVVPEMERADDVRRELKQLLHDRYHIMHSTLELVRPEDAQRCARGGKCGIWTAEALRQKSH